MKFIINVNVNKNISSGDFGSPDDRITCALNCSKSAIELNLHDLSPNVYVDKNVIIIELENHKDVGVDDLTPLIMPAFSEHNGNLSDEYKYVTINHILT